MSAVDAFLADINRTSLACRAVVKDNLPDASSGRAKKRQRNDELHSRKQQLTVDLHRLREQHSGSKKSWLRDFVHDTCPFTRKDPKAFTMKRQLCYNLVFQRKHSSLEHGQEDGQLAKCEQSSYKDSLVDLPPGRGRPKKARGLNSTGRSAAKKASQRKRRHGGGAPREMPRNWGRVI
jgi:hypothetical protein